ncbi:ankyrin repeat domain-containing protein [Streptomyces sp. NRRL B-1347]|uniref:ankyrin repeat domain-containing protein n=1 Tax=Streptomyces sp. NRRL B-1347 TaxID=1476877 RepID=UPI0004CB135A|nr:ankyrin repeat domain-containing protein [Streptomyces sp. NRRL B-1347]
MGFFDDLVLPEEPPAERAALVRLGPPGEDVARYAPPVDWFAPVSQSQLEMVGIGPQVRVVLTGWTVWPRSATLHLSVFRRTRWRSSDTTRQSGLRVGLLFQDGRRVTSLDPTVDRFMSWTASDGKARSTVTPQHVGLIPLDPGLHHSRRTTFKTDVELYLAELPPPDEAQLIIEWPDEGIGETRTTLGTAALHAASAQVIEVWPGIDAPDPAEQPSSFARLEVSGPPSFLAPPLTGRQLETLRRQEEERQRYVPRADWERMGHRDWQDAALVRVRLGAGAPPDARVGWPGTVPLHLAAEFGAAEAVGALLEHGAEADVADEDGLTPLWYAACSVDEGCVRALITAGADVWTPQTGPWSPGRLLLTTPLAPLVADLPGAVELPIGEAAAFRAADALIAAFGEQELWTEGLGICFVRDLTEDEVIRRLGADPAQCPTADLDHAPFSLTDSDASLRHVGVRNVPGAPGGCVLTQEGYMPSDAAVLRAISAGTAAYGIYFNAKGGTFGTLARDGEIVADEEIGLPPDESDPPAYWHFRFWQRQHAFPHDADTFAYACAAVGLRVSDGRPAVDRRAARRWVELPASLRR